MPYSASRYRRKYTRVRRRSRTYKRRNRGNYNTLYRSVGPTRQLNNSVMPARYNYVRRGDEIRWQMMDIADQFVPRIAAGGAWPTTAQLEYNIGAAPTVTKAAGPGSLMDIERGTSVHDRLSSKLCIKRVTYDLFLRARNMAEASDYSDYSLDPVRIIVIAIRNERGSWSADAFRQLPSYGLATNRASFHAPFRKEAGNIYRVLYDKVINVNDPTLTTTYTYTASAGNTVSNDNVMRSRGRLQRHKITVRPNLVVQYTDAATTGDYSERDTSIFIMAFSPYEPGGAFRPVEIGGTCTTYFTP